VTDPDAPYEAATIAAEQLRERLGTHQTALVLGSGWTDAANGLGTTEGELAGHQLPGVPVPTVTGHRGTLRSVRVATPAGEQRVLVIAGRSHLYEGHAPEVVVHLVRTAVLSGCGRVVLTNAAGSLRTEVGVGRVVVISDQINLMGANPMVGPAPEPQFPSRFVDLSDLYPAGLRAALAARRPDLVEGVYAGLLGGSFETPAEIRMLRTLGADLVGMSTVLEAIAAHHLGAEVIGLSLVTNLAAGLQTSVDHLEVLAAGDAATDELRRTLADVLALR